MNEISTTEDKASRFNGEIVSTSTLGIATELLPAEARQYIDNLKYENSMFFEAREGGEVLGFAKVEYSSDKSKTPEFVYRYIIPENRRRGIGQQLRDSVYRWLKEQGYEKVSSGINTVGTILPTGEISPHIDSNEDGGWKSYMSMTREKDGNVQHSINSITVERNGSFDLSFLTYLQTDSSKLLPSNAADLIRELESNVLPKDSSLTDLLTQADKETVVVASSGKTYEFLDWMRQQKRLN